MAEKVALEQVETGESVMKIAPKYGYSIATAQSGKIQKTKSYREIMARDTEQTLARMALLRANALKEAKKKTKSAKYGELISSADTMTKNIQLLTGGSTGEQPVIKIVLFGDTLIAPVIETKTL